MSTATLRIKLDKGRLRIPVAFRELLRGTGSVWITNHFVNHERSLVLCAPDVREKIATRSDQVAPTDREQALFKTFFVGSAAELAIDQRRRVRV